MSKNLPKRVAATAAVGLILSGAVAPALSVIPGSPIVAKADEAMKHITESADAFCESHPDEYNKKTDELLDFVQYQIMKKCVSEELKNA